jgi:hypothetical protein
MLFSVLRLAQVAVTAALFSSALGMTSAYTERRSIALPGAKAFPESITSTLNGTLFIGRLGEGGVVRANPRTGEAALFVAPGASGSRSIAGVFADDASNTLWACSNDLSALGGLSSGRDHGSALMGFDLETGVARLSVPLPGAHAFCNDIAVDTSGAVYVTDSAGPNVLWLRAGASAFEVFASNPQFLPPPGGGAGLDGIAFGGDGNLYVTTYTAGALFRIDVERGRAGRVIKLHGARLSLPDALRPFGERSFLLVEGAGTLDRVDIEVDEFKAVLISGGFRTPTSVTRVGSTAWVSEGQLPFFFDRSRKNQSPSLPFLIYAAPLSRGQTQ